MSNSVNLPADFYFDLENTARLFTGSLPGALDPPGQMCPLGPEFRIVSSSSLAGLNDFADVRCAWESNGLAFVFNYPAPKRPMPGLVKFNIWLDTRNTRNIHRATRFCHQFRLEFDPTVLIGRSRAANETMAPGAELSQIRINRALADAPVAPSDTIYTDCRQYGSGGFRLALFFTAKALNGFDPEVNSMLGLAYRLQLPNNDLQRLGAGVEFPTPEDPSLWTSLRLEK